MKIIDKIVTSKTAPKQLNVVWHNNDTNELKIWGNKGWELVGGNPNASSGGYPVVTVEKDFNIEALPNTFYNIKNAVNDEISINFKDEEFYSTGTDKILLFTFDDVNEITSLFLEVSETLGIAFKKDTSKEGYKYKSVIDLSDLGYGTTIIYTKEYPTSGKDLEVCVSNDVVGLDNVEMTLTNIIVFNENIDSIIEVNTLDTQIYGLCIKEVENDNAKFNHKYDAYIGGRYTYLYTLEPYPNCSTVYVKIFDDGEPDYEDATNIKIYKNPVEISNHINEFIFNINSPAKIVFNNEVKWNNGNTPDFTKSGTCTLSILNGVGCYTFIE